MSDAPAKTPASDAGEGFARKPTGVLVLASGEVFYGEGFGAVVGDDEGGHPGRQQALPQIGAQPGAGGRAFRSAGRRPVVLLPAGHQRHRAGGLDIGDR